MRFAIAGLAVLCAGYLCLPLYAGPVSDGLIALAWQASVRTGQPVKPWPWMRSYPVARLSVPGEKAMVVLAGADPAVLAYAPVWHEGSVQPGRAGISLITGDPQKHFGFLKNLRPGDSLDMLDASGRAVEYRIEALQVIDTTEMRIDGAERDSILILTTAYPSGNWPGSGAVRMVAVARAVDQDDIFHFAGLLGPIGLKP